MSPSVQELEAARQGQAETPAQEIARLREENAKLLAARSTSLSCRVSEKGALSVYGLGRFPVTLYKEQWARLFDFIDTIKAFIKANDSKLKAKAPKESQEDPKKVVNF